MSPDPAVDRGMRRTLRSTIGWAGGETEVDLDGTTRQPQCAQPAVAMQCESSVENVAPTLPKAGREDSHGSSPLRDQPGRRVRLADHHLLVASDGVSADLARCILLRSARSLLAAAFWIRDRNAG